MMATNRHEPLIFATSSTATSRSIITSPQVRRSVAAGCTSAPRSEPWSLFKTLKGMVTHASSYNMRIEFTVLNVSWARKLSNFDIYFGDSLWSTVNFTDEGTAVDIELIHVAKFTSLSTFRRLDFGSTTNEGCRFPFDAHDRYWSPYNDDKEYTKISTPLTIDADSERHNDYYPASAVMGTAATGINSSKPMEYSWNSEDKNTQYYVYLHFAEVVPNQTRGFNITYNGQLWYGPLIPNYLYTTTILSTGPLSANTRHEFSFIKIENSTLPPIINALEIYSVTEIFELRSFQEDEDTIRNIKSIYGVIKDWEGDPCVPKAYPWSGLDCNNETTPRIISLNLSSSGLTGAIYPYISNLTMLQTLDLSNNNLKGEVPDSLSKLPNLKILKLDNNNLTGQIPPELIKRSNENSLSLSVKGNPNLDTCALGPCTKEEEKKSFVVPVVASVGGLLVIVIIAAIIFWISTLKW